MAQKRIDRVGVVGAGTMGSGIAQKIASAGIPVTLVDADEDRVAAGKHRIERLLTEGMERQIFAPEQVDEILLRIDTSGNVAALSGCDLVIEAIYEDLPGKQQLFIELAKVCASDTILASNTSSFLIADIAAGTPHPERVVGLHYFYHPAKNRLVEVIGHSGSAETVLGATWAFAQRSGMTPVASADSPGFLVNRFFVPWLNEAVRLHEEGMPLATIEAVAKDLFGVGMGPFALMNATGIAIAMHAARSLEEKLGPFYAPAAALVQQVENQQDWSVTGSANNSVVKDPDAVAQAVADRLLAVVFYIAAALADEGVGSKEDIDIGARVGLRWASGPFERINLLSVGSAAALCEDLRRRYGLAPVPLLQRQLELGVDFDLRHVRLEVGDQGVATITLNRPDALNALSPAMVTQLAEAVESALNDEAVSGLVICGAGKAFVAGADVKYFIDQLRGGNVSDIVDFATQGQRLFRRIELAEKPVVCRLDGVALGGGAELMLACHAVVATSGAVVGFPETGIGIYPGLGGTQRLTRRVGKGLARYLLYTGETLNAEQLEQLGLVWRVVDTDRLPQAIAVALAEAPKHQPAAQDNEIEAFAFVSRFLGAVDVEALYDGSLTLPGGHDTSEVARKLRQKALNALLAVERLTEAAERCGMDEGLGQETDGLHAVFAHANALEGMTALLARRRPKFIAD